MQIGIIFGQILTRTSVIDVYEGNHIHWLDTIS